ncbi:uncharacterized protein SAPINGB_P004326 [Magnusiomyces paraingens]|uniref:BSD domain-containing protein n=1 Tax=Magnusiomyces paraingens TaxID=2606893 RepID=A0A5E8C1C6_9ASCO|nr:uncharacterized protein SAPINGB_P004326 [Saprochaete ingens]VVT54915.1 unnamed protein product [Saprochaete ingens]
MDTAYDHLGAITAAPEKTAEPIMETTSVSDDKSSSSPSVAESDKPTEEDKKEDKSTDEKKKTTPTPEPLVPAAAAEAFDKAADQLENSINAWGSALGGFWSKVKKQGGETLSKTIRETKLELQGLKSELDDLIGDTVKKGVEGEETKEEVEVDKKETTTENASEESKTEKPPSKGSFFDSIASAAQKYVDDLDKDLEQLENRAGKRLLQMGTDLQSVLKDAVIVSGPSAEAKAASSGEVLFHVPEDIRDQIYTTRVDAQLHALHTTAAPFTSTEAPGPGYAEFQKTFDVEGATERIAGDLKQYPKLRGLMESVVGPGKVSYGEFWARYYYMRGEIEAQEQKRKTLLQSAAEGNNEDEEFNWGDDDDDDGNEEEEEDGDNEKKKKKSEVKSEVEPEVKSEVKPEVKSEIKPEIKPEVKPEVKSEVKPEVKPEVKSEDKTTGDDVNEDDGETMTVKASPKAFPIGTGSAPGSSRPSSEASYDLVSKTPSILDLPSKVKEAELELNKNDESKAVKESVSDEDSDDDWE